MIEALPGFGWIVAMLVAAVSVVALRDLIVEFLLEPYVEPLVHWFQRTFLGIDAVRAGPETLIGQTGLVHADFELVRPDVGYSGSVRVGGEVWTARAPLACAAGTRVRVVGRDGLVLAVESVSH